MGNIVTIDNIPVYDAIIEDDDCGMLRISLVDDPAVMKNFLAYDKEKKMMLYAIEDEEHRKVLGVVMRADFPIYRRDNERGEYYIRYTADTIAKMAEKYLLESRQNEVNLDHDDNKVVDGVQMVQYFIKDSAKGVSPAGFDDIADGSLFAEFHVVNDDVWQEIKDGTYRGFSLEGIFALAPEENADEIQTIVDSLDGKFSRLFKNNSNRKHKMSKVSKFLKALESALVSVACGSTTTDKGVIVWDGDEDLKEGDEVFMEDAEGNRTPCEDGDYTTDDGKVIKVAGGKVESIVDSEAEVAGGRIATDGGELVWDGEDDLKAGDAVYVEDAEGNRTSAPDGDYKTEDGKVIKVVDGAVAEIADPEAEVAPADVNAAEEMPEEAPAEKSLEERVNALEALVAKMAEWMGIVVIDDKGNEVMARCLNDQMSEIKAEMNKIAQKPSTEPAHEQFKKSAELVKTGDKGLDNFARILKARR